MESNAFPYRIELAVAYYLHLQPIMRNGGGSKKSRTVGNSWDLYTINHETLNHKNWTHEISISAWFSCLSWFFSRHKRYLGAIKSLILAPWVTNTFSAKAYQFGLYLRYVGKEPNRFDARVGNGYKSAWRSCTVSSSTYAQSCQAPVVLVVRAGLRGYRDRGSFRRVR